MVESNNMNRFAVDAPQVGHVQKYVPTVVKEGTMTFANTTFEDNSINILSAISKKLPAFWKEVTRLKREASKIELAEAKEGYRVRSAELAEEARIENERKQVARDKEIEDNRIIQENRFMDSELRRTTNEAKAKQREDAAKINAENKRNWAHTEAALSNRSSATHRKGISGEDADGNPFTKEQYMEEIEANKALYLDAVQTGAFEGSEEKAMKAWNNQYNTFFNWEQAQKKLDEAAQKELDEKIALMRKMGGAYSLPNLLNPNSGIATDTIFPLGVPLP